MADLKTQSAVVRQIEIMGEAVKQLSDETKALEQCLHPEDAQVFKSTWQAEIKKRFSQIDNAEVSCRPWDAVMADLQAIAEA